jgi:molybdopterin synthase sulfur carrier subunit
MAIRILYFASLREALGKGEDSLECSDRLNLREIWTQVGATVRPHEQVLCALNQEYADWETTVRDGDEVAFFPPVTGG